MLDHETDLNEFKGTDNTHNAFSDIPKKKLQKLKIK